VLPEIVALDVGQGDSVLIRLPGRTEVLIDGGGSPFSDFDVGAGIVVPALRALGVDELELVVATHSDTDHLEGLPAVLAAFPVQQLAVGVPAPGVRVWDDLVDAAAATGVPVREVRRGMRIVLGEAVFTVLHPEARTRGATNEDSVGLAFSWRGRPVALFLGDMSTSVETNLAVPPSPLLMVPHHGSRHSTSDALLRAAQPKLAVVSVGRNGYGHPAPAVLERLAAARVEVRTTQSEGYVRISVPDLLRP
jgi:competence protein ComEC